MLSLDPRKRRDKPAWGRRGRFSTSKELRPAIAPSRASAAREGGGEASVGVVQARLLSRETGEVWGVDALWIGGRQHPPVPDQGPWLRSVLQGHFNYYAVPDNSEVLFGFRRQAVRQWRRSLRGAASAPT
jgi:hypothetical protein